jgi:hypothetical protein
MSKFVWFLVFILLFSCHSLSEREFKNDIDYKSAIYNFVINGFYHDLDERKIYGADILLHFGEIISISVHRNIQGQEYLNIEFDTIYIPIYNSEYIDLYKNQNITNEIFSNFAVGAITAKDNVHYLYDVKIGMKFDDFINIFGEIEDDNKYIYNNKIIYFDWGINHGTGEKGETLFMMALRKGSITEGRDKFVAIRFNENKIQNIRWVL